jgi:hypothetical protein
MVRYVCCDRCGGSGQRFTSVTCSQCGGSGSITRWSQCDANGRVLQERCGCSAGVVYKNIACEFCGGGGMQVAHDQRSEPAVAPSPLVIFSPDQVSGNDPPAATAPLIPSESKGPVRVPSVPEALLRAVIWPLQFPPVWIVLVAALLPDGCRQKQDRGAAKPPPVVQPKEPASP